MPAPPSDPPAADGSSDVASRRLPTAVALLLALLAPGCGTSSHASAPPGDAGEDALSSRAANGSLGAWSTLAPMPVTRANFCAVVVGRAVLVVGGNYPSDGGFTALDEIDLAVAADDGTLGPWTVAGKAPSPVTQCTVAAGGGTIFLMDGIYEDDSKGGRVYTATFDGSTLGAWAPAAALPGTTRLISQAAWTNGDALLALDSDVDGTTYVLSGSVAAGATQLAQTPWVPQFRGAPQWAVTPAAAYMLGGYADADAGNAVLADGFGALESTMPLGAAFAVGALPEPTTFGAGVGVDDWVFVLGGRDGVLSGAARPGVVSAQASADGTLGPWAAQAPMPEGRTNFVVVSAGDYVYALGGAGTQATDTVFAAQARF